MNAARDRTFACAAFVSLGGFVFGFDASVISGVTGFVVPQFNLNDWQLGLLVAAPTLAAIPSAALASPIADAIGRRKVLLALAVLYTVSAVASAFAPNYEVLVAARLLGGLAFSSLAIAPMYIGEIAPPARRGLLVSVNQMNIVVGFSAAYFANWLVLQLSQSDNAWVQTLGLDSHAWRWMLGLEILPAVAWFVLLLGIPESPRWLVLRQRLDEARAVLVRLRGALSIEAELAAIRNSLPGDVLKSRFRLSALLAPRLRWPMGIALIVGIAQQVTGINAVYFYAPTIFEQSGVGTNAAFAQATLIGIVNIVFTVVAMLCIDRFGRRPLLIIGLSGIVLSMAVAGYGFSQARYELRPAMIASLPAALDRQALEPLLGQIYADDVSFKRALGAVVGEQAVRDHGSAIIQAAIQINPWAVLAGILGFVASFAMSLGPVMWTLFSEIFPNRIRGLALAVAGLFNSLSSFLVQFMFPWEISNLGAAMTFLVYAVLGLLALLLVLRYLPETRGRSLEQLEAMLAAGRGGGRAPA